MERKEIIEKVNESILNILCDVDKADIKETAELSSLGADSLDVLEIQMEIEKNMNVGISDAELEKISTVGDLYELVAQKVKSEE